MSTYEFAAPYFERPKRDPRVLKAAAALAFRSAKEKTFKPAMYSQEEVAARSQAFEGAASTAGWLINNLSKMLGQAQELKGSRALPDGRMVAIEHVRSSFVNKKGKKVERDPKTSPWRLSITGPDGKLAQAFQIKLNHGSSPQPAEIMALNKRGEAQLAKDLAGDIAVYNQVRQVLDILMAGLPDKSTRFTKKEALRQDNVRGLHAHRVHSRPAQNRPPEVRLAA